MSNFRNDNNNNKFSRKTLRPAVRNTIASLQGYCCKECSRVFGPIFHIDHIRALCLGGEDDLKNMCALCPNCHAEKTSHDMRIYWDNHSSSQNSQICSPKSISEAIKLLLQALHILKDKGNINKVNSNIGNTNIITRSGRIIKNVKKK
jgi:hypothetical protein